MNWFLIHFGSLLNRLFYLFLKYFFFFFNVSLIGGVKPTLTLTSTFSNFFFNWREKNVLHILNFSNIWVLEKKQHLLVTVMKIAKNQVLTTKKRWSIIFIFKCKIFFCFLLLPFISNELASLVTYLDPTWHLTDKS